jgi:hypothetical protein
VAWAKQVFLGNALFCAIAAAQASDTRYLLRLDHSNFEGHSCALLQTAGAFHLEIDDGDNVRVFEGSIEPNDVLKIEADLNAPSLTNLSQPQIQEPLIRTRHDELQLSTLRGETWQDLFFQSSDSQEPLKRWLRPLTHWLDTLPRAPHRELSEDEGANRCLPVGAIALKRRGDPHPESVTPKTTMHVLYGGPTPQPQPPPPMALQSVQPLLLLHSLEMTTLSAHEWCTLVGEDGMYRFEDRTQKAGKAVKTKIMAGQIRRSELQQLRQILDDSELAAIKHHEPPGHGDVLMMGNKLDISISRPAGVQHFILSSRFNRPDFPSFYSGDADLSTARPLLKFLSEHVENNMAGLLDPSKRNGCTEAP